MNRRQSFRATENLKLTIARRERSAAWVARKARISQQLLSYVIGNQRSISEEKALRVAAVLNEPIEFLFVPSSTSMVISTTSKANELVEQMA